MKKEVLMKPLSQESYIRAEEGLLRKRLTDRKAQGMASYEEAEAFVDFSDMRNARRCLAHSGRADLTLEMIGDGEFSICEE